MNRCTGVPPLSVYLYHLSHVALGACVLSGVFNFHEHDKEQVVPHVVLFLDVLLERHGLVVELVPLQTCRGTAEVRTQGSKNQEVSCEIALNLNTDMISSFS